jgi:hypothetical protein
MLSNNDARVGAMVGWDFAGFLSLNLANPMESGIGWLSHGY